jgi:SNF2 family DNA or RNA helicase
MRSHCPKVAMISKLAGTLEENIDEIIERKKIIASSTVGSGEGWLTELSTDDLRNIFDLRETAFVD